MTWMIVFAYACSAVSRSSVMKSPIGSPFSSSSLPTMNWPSASAKSYTRFMGELGETNFMVPRGWFVMVLICASWCFMVLHGASWVSWRIMVLHGFSWCFMVLHGASWLVMARHGGSWLVMMGRGHGAAQANRARTSGRAARSLRRRYLLVS